MTDPDTPDTSADAVEANPFDVGLPMLRTPARPPRRRPTPPPEGGEDEPLPELEEESDEHEGEWQEWLDQPRLRIDSWDDDEDLTANTGLVDRTGTPGIRRPRGQDAPPRPRRRGVLLAGVLAVVVIGSAALALTHSGTRTEQPAAPEGSGGAAATSATPSRGVVSEDADLAVEGCAPFRSPELVVGVVPDGAGDAADLILALEHAYYVLRSGDAAAATLAPGATATRVDGSRAELTAADIQRGIDLTPAGTRYCVQITPDPKASDRWRVELTEQRPQQPPTLGIQLITIGTTGTGDPLITAIDAG
ncbi:hypothetical protein [Nocardia cyriacigeorgica]|uniref:hypothetical protein n=1 Tax=Nocardia cyriacigeorgica TaxID=135487 RepID=UPI0024586B82|nr:hypothetical protein [Nocardia cyriacigeorgica]